MASRMQVAAYVADRLTDDRAGAVRSAAAWLAAKGQGRQARYLARDVAQVLSARGYVHARVTTARPLAGEARREVERFIKEATGGRELELETAVDPGMIGGITIETPGQALDASVRTKLAHYIEGATS
ncbi:MAG: atpH [Patescibacteria group bacterium]|nr:atpH [Patescibacteria group bacterium]